MFRLARFTVLLALAPLSIAPVAICAQETLTSASVTGRVLDPSGALVPRATITALQIATNQSHVVQTDGQGRFRLPYLPAGGYQISAQAEGFSVTSRQVELNVCSAFDITLQFKFPTADTTVKVTAEPPVIEGN